MADKDDDPPLHLTRTLEGFAPSTNLDRELVERWGVGVTVRARLTKPRSRREENFFWAVVRVCWRHQDHYATPEALAAAIKFRLGHVDHVEMKNGVTIIIPRSVKTMQYADYHEFVTRVLEVVYAEIVPGLDAAGRKYLIHEVDKLSLLIT